MVVLLVALVVAACAWFYTRGDVSPAEAHRLVAAGALLLDVRTREEYGEGHLPHAVNVPVQEIDRRLAELQPASRPIVVYCRSGHRSANAAETLRAAGFRVHDLGPKARW